MASKVVPRHPSAPDNGKHVCRSDAGGQASGGDDIRLGEVMDTAMQELLRRPSSVQEQARIESKGLRGSQVAETAEQCARTSKDWEQRPQGIPRASVGNNRPRSANGDGEQVTPA
jgi:hypothetical protein